ncbi:MAG TPA: carboxymuconolactone decarboxylase family protein [Pyrinomonadaceae bacterium]
MLSPAEMKAAPGSVQAMYKLEKYVQESGLEHSLLELVKTRVSRINGCAFCLDMHTKDARRAGESWRPLEQQEVPMSEEDLQLLITLDDPWNAQEWKVSKQLT